MQKGVSTANLRLLSLERPLLKAGLASHLGIWISGVIPPFLKWLAVPTRFADNAFYAQHLLSIGECRVLCVLGRGYLCDHIPGETLGSGSLMNFPDGQYVTHVVTTHC